MFDPYPYFCSCPQLFATRAFFSRMLTEFGTVSTWKNIHKSFLSLFFRFHRRAFSSQSRTCSLAGHQSIACPGSNVAKLMVLYMYGNVLNSLYSNAMFQWTKIILILMYKNALSKSYNFIIMYKVIRNKRFSQNVHIETCIRCTRLLFKKKALYIIIVFQKSFYYILTTIHMYPGLHTLSYVFWEIHSHEKFWYGDVYFEFQT